MLKARGAVLKFWRKSPLQVDYVCWTVACATFSLVSQPHVRNVVMMWHIWTVLYLYVHSQLMGTHDGIDYPECIVAP